MKTIVIAVLILIASHSLAAWGAWSLATARQEAAKSARDTEALVAAEGRSQRAGVVAGRHAEWQHKQAAVVDEQKEKVNEAIQDAGDWGDQRLPDSVRKSLAAAAAAISSATYADGFVPSAAASGAGDERGTGEVLGAGPGRLAPVPRAAHTTH